MINCKYVLTYILYVTSKYVHQIQREKDEFEILSWNVEVFWIMNKKFHVWSKIPGSSWQYKLSWLLILWKKKVLSFGLTSMITSILKVWDIWRLTSPRYFGCGLHISYKVTPDTRTLAKPPECLRNCKYWLRYEK